MKEYPLVLDLPASLSREIGRVIVAYAAMEMVLSKIIYALLGVGPKEGRLAIREPRALDRFELIRDLANLSGIADYPGTKLLAEGIKEVMIQRDQLAHGVWVRHPETGKLLLRLTKGQWQPVKGQRGNTKRLVKPEGIIYGPESARSLHSLIMALIPKIDHYGQAIQQAVQTSRRESPEASGEPSQTHSQSLIESPSTPLPSAE